HWCRYRRFSCQLLAEKIARQSAQCKAAAGTVSPLLLWGEGPFFIGSRIFLTPSQCRLATFYVAGRRGQYCTFFEEVGARKVRTDPAPSLRERFARIQSANSDLVSSRISNTSRRSLSDIVA